MKSNRETAAVADNERIDLGRSKELLRKKLLELAPADATEYETCIPGFVLHRINSVNQPRPYMYKPVIIVVVQGSKMIRIGDEEFVYGEGNYFVTGVDLAVSGCLVDATPDRPYLSLSLDLDKGLIARMAAEVPPDGAYGNATFRCGMVHEIDPELLDAFLRLTELVPKPKEASHLGPLILREIHYRLLTGPFGNRLRSIHTHGSQSHQIATAIHWLREHFAEPFQIEDLARKVNMAPSTFHKHFSQMTALSPIQYRTRLRLTEAQRLMIQHNMDVAGACFAVGYESHTQFNREYKRLFGEPPLRDARRLRGALPTRNHL